MYSYIKGVIVEKHPNKLILDVGNIGYEIIVPLSVSSKSPSVNQEVKVLTYLLVREDEIKLIGFLANEEKDLFKRLITLPGIGPSLALQILSSVTPQEFMIAIERQDIAFLKKIKGIGEKTAKKIILELKGAKTFLENTKQTNLPEGVGMDAVNALITLGISEAEAVKRIDNLLQKNPELNNLEEIIKLALRM